MGTIRILCFFSKFCQYRRQRFEKLLTACCQKKATHSCVTLIEVFQTTQMGCLTATATKHILRQVTLHAGWSSDCLVIAADPGRRSIKSIVKKVSNDITQLLLVVGSLGRQREVHPGVIVCIVRELLISVKCTMSWTSCHQFEILYLKSTFPLHSTHPLVLCTEVSMKLPGTYRIAPHL